MVNDPNKEIPQYQYRWEFLDEEKQFNFDQDVVLSGCEWKERKLSLFDDFLQEIDNKEKESEWSPILKKII